EGIPSDLYPDIARSLVLMERLMAYEVSLSDSSHRVSLFDYFTNHRKTSFLSNVAKYTIKLPLSLFRFVQEAFSSDSELSKADQFSIDLEKQQRILHMSHEEWNVVRQLRGRVYANLGRDSEIVTIS